MGSRFEIPMLEYLVQLEKPVRSTLLSALVVLALVPQRGLEGQGVADHVALGTAAVQAHDLRSGLAHFEAALELDSMNYEANWRAALALEQLGEQIPDTIRSPERDSLYARSERFARRAVAADSNGADGHFALAAAIGRESLTKGTKERIRMAKVIRDEAMRTIALNPRHDGAYHILGRWNAEIMRLSGFSRFFAKSFLGAGIFKQASWDNAIANMEKAVELDPGRIYHRLELAEIYVDRKRWNDARAQVRQVADLPERELLDSTYKAEAARLAARIARKH
jgi:tetratricopeptide (TPR) repeat protein